MSLTVPRPARVFLADEVEDPQLHHNTLVTSPTSDRSRSLSAPDVLARAVHQRQLLMQTLLPVGDAQGTLWVVLSGPAFLALPCLVLSCRTGSPSLTLPLSRP